jgi:uncharacterized protein DUF1570
MFSGILLLAAALPNAPTGATGGFPNLAFESGRLDRWEGGGFYVTTANGHGPSRDFAVCSSDSGPGGRRGVLHRTFIVPPNVSAIRFAAAAVRAPGCAPGPILDVVLEGEEGKRIGKQVRADKTWQPTKALLPSQHGRPREYRFAVSGLAGQTVRIAIHDEDDRPGCYVLCSGFRFESIDESNSREFADHMIKLVVDNDLHPVTRFDSRHFMALSNAGDDYTEDRLTDCEMIYALFFDHFRRKGFSVREPREKLMVAVFDTPTGFEAYIGAKKADSVLGIYEPVTNRLVVYDYGQNRAFVSAKQLADRSARQLTSDLARERAVGSVNRHLATFRKDANIGAVMHEVAHQLSFNCGLLNRQSHVPAWLAEGLACYCESTENGAWQGIGEPNPMRAGSLAVPIRTQGQLIPLRSLIESDDWLRKATDSNQVLLGYAQSWALFSWLMEKRPEKLRKYLALIESRRTPDHRLADFAEVFGSDFDKLDASYKVYMRDVVRDQARTR